MAPPDGLLEAVPECFWIEIDRSCGAVFVELYGAPGTLLDGFLLEGVNGTDGSVYKTNFWDVAFQAYDPFYPPGVLAAFYDPNNPANNVDIGLPVPDVEKGRP